MRIYTQAESYPTVVSIYDFGLDEYDASFEIKGMPVAEMNPKQLAAYKAYLIKQKEEGKRWNLEHPVSAKNVIDHYHNATDDERKQGDNWYSDAHEMAKSIANDTKTPMHTMAGLVSNYSPQTDWATNMINAARVARKKVAQGGKGEGIMATGRQKVAAQRMLNGEHYDKVLAGEKTRAFAHLIEHGGNADEKDQKVVVDRHALSVASGSRASDSAYMESRLGTKGRYKEVSDTYREAARQLSKEYGRDIKPHQVQAATWLARQRMNEDEDREHSETGGSRSAEKARDSIEHWNKYAMEHHPGALGKAPGTGYSRDVPEDVKTAHELAKEQGLKR